jgi:hypothetical protein
MVFMEKALEYILRKFPDHRDTMTDLYCTDDDFRILCDDYLTTVKTLEERRIKVLGDMVIENEYLQLSLDLEEEIIRTLHKRAK